MFDLPLHPALVHLPLAFVFFGPLLGVAMLRAGLKGGEDSENRRRGLWRYVVIRIFVQSLAVYATMVTGERDSDVVIAHFEESEPPIATLVGSHEDAATWLLLVSLGSLLLSFMALKPGPQSRTLSLATIAVQTLALACAVYTAKLGGELVYRHGAAEAHLETQPPADQDQSRTPAAP